MTADISFIQNRQSTQPVNAIGNETQELVDVLQKIVRNTCTLLEVSDCSIALLDEAGSSLVTQAAIQKPGRKVRHTRFHLNEGIAGWVAEHREPLIINDVSRDARFKRLGRIPIGSMICVPLIDDDHFIGTLTASSPDINVFNTKKAHILVTFAAQAVVALTNARHAKQARQHADQLELLMDLSRDLTTRLDIDVLYQTLLSDARQLIPCNQAILYRYHDATQMLYPVAELASPDASSTTEPGNVTIKVTDVQQEKIHVYSVDTIAAWAATHRHPMLRAPYQAPNIAAPPMVDVAEMAAPFVSRNILYGVLVLKRSWSFSSEELLLLRHLSNIATAALENVELLRTVRSDQEQLRAILTTSSDGIALAEGKGSFIEANQAFGRIFGIDAQHVVGMECLELLDEGDKDTNADKIQMVQTAFQQVQPLPYTEFDLIIQDATRTVGLSITPVATAHQPLYLIIARDVTAIRDVTRMKAHFLSMITHELRSPLNSINGYLDLVLSGVGGELNDQLREFLQRARSGSEHLYALVEDLLLVSRADSGQLRLNREIINLRSNITNTIEELELTALDRHIDVTVDLPKDLPRVYADPVRIQQVIRNLLSNALRFTDTGGQVTISAQVENSVPDPVDDESSSSIKLSISDNGCGIAPEHQQRIFERFYQVPQKSSRQSGQGLGLAIVKMIIELHGGHVSLVSAPGQGSTFTCIIPGVLS